MYTKKELDFPKAIASSISEIFSFFSDKPGGAWALAILCELLQEMITTENWPAAEIVVREIHQVAEVDLPDEPIDQSAIQMFCDLLTDCIIEAEELNTKEHDTYLLLTQTFYLRASAERREATLSAPYAPCVPPLHRG